MLLKQSMDDSRLAKTLRKIFSRGFSHRGGVIRLV